MMFSSSSSSAATAADNPRFSCSTSSNVWSFLLSTWKCVTDFTSADNSHPVSLVARVLLTATSFCVLYSRTIGLLLHAMAYLVQFHWYALAITTSTVVLVLSTALLASYEWMWRWQSNVLSPTNNNSHNNITMNAVSTLRRPVTIEEDDDDDTWKAWALRLCRIFGILIVWSIYCWTNVQLDYFIFWSNYATAHPDYNLELIFVNALQAAPILVGAAYTIYHLYPPFYSWHYRPADYSPTPTLEPNNDSFAPAMETLL